MNASIATQDPTRDDAPIHQFTQCHVGLLRRLEALDGLPALLAPAARAREIARQALDFFGEAIAEHHADEERELFPAVLASAQPGQEREQVQSLTRRLTDEHRVIETLWQRLEKGLKRVAKGQSTDLDTSELHRLVNEYQAHAAFEESEFLPLSEAILGRNGNHMAALGVSLHMRHVKPVTAYI